MAGIAGKKWNLLYEFSASYNFGGGCIEMVIRGVNLNFEPQRSMGGQSVLVKKYFFRERAIE